MINDYAAENLGSSSQAKHISTKKKLPGTDYAWSPPLSQQSTRNQTSRNQSPHLTNEDTLGDHDVS